MRVAVADVGTNSSHLLIAESLPGRAGASRVIDTLRHPTRLGECLDEAGYMTQEGERRLAEALTQFRELATSAGVSDVRVYATSALREAQNGNDIAEKVREQTGLYPAIISGQREGELTYLGVREAVELGDDNVLLDLGGGSLELVRGDRQLARDVLSLPLGAIRMTRAFPEGTGRNAAREVVTQVEQEVRRLLLPELGRFEQRPGTQFFLSSGTAKAAAIAIAARRGARSKTVNSSSFSVEELGSLLSEVARQRPAQRTRLSGLERRADIILAALSVLHTALSLLGAREVTVSEGALREGMLIEEIAQLQNFSHTLSTRQRSVLAVAERFGVNLAHAGHVAKLSRDLFDALLSEGESFAPEARSLLTAAAVLHESGQIVNQSAHHKHSAYLIRYAGLRGFNPREIELIAQIARYHRRSLPRTAHPEYLALSPADRTLVSRLAGILRVADGLDRAHTGSTQLESLRRTRSGWTLTVQGATPLDLAGVGEKGDLWTQEFGAISVYAAASQTA